MAVNKLELWAKADSEGSNMVMAFYKSEPPNEVKTSPVNILGGFTAPDFIEDDGEWHLLSPGQTLNVSGGKRYWLGVEGTSDEYLMAVTLMPDGEYKVFSGQVRKTLLSLLEDELNHYWAELPELLDNPEEEGFGLREFLTDARANLADLKSLYAECFAEFATKSDDKKIKNRFATMLI